MNKKKKYILISGIGILVVLVLFIFVVHKYLDLMIELAYLDNPVSNLFQGISNLNREQALKFFYEDGYGYTSYLYLLSLLLNNWFVISFLLALFVLLFYLVGTIIYLIHKQEQEKEQLALKIQNGDLNEEDIILNAVQHKEQLYRNKIITSELSLQKQKDEYENIAHQIKSSLSVIYLNLDRIDNKDNGEYINKIENQLDCTNELVNQFLKASTITENQTNYSFQVCDLKKGMEQSILNVKDYAKSRDISIEYDCQSFILSIDLFWIQEAIETILKNAIDHANEHSIVYVSLKQDHNKALIAIQNDGYIDESMNIFERFQSANIDQEHYGIGLHMASNIIEHHFGTIQVKQEDGKVIFTISLLIHPLENFEL
ncbi:sensor histidine kinase [Floccifex sp.]|uniref:sensor histidine kinase n=1 Tax=Floccifex sp. TaxID=2815810 RepID=UPI003EFF827D